MSIWRYQVVYVEQGDSRLYSLCEVYFDESGKLDNWTQPREIAPDGENVGELVSDLQNMIVDAVCWEPVAYADLKHGFEFDLNVGMTERADLADRVEHWVNEFKTRGMDQSGKGSAN